MRAASESKAKFLEITLSSGPPFCEPQISEDSEKSRMMPIRFSARAAVVKDSSQRIANVCKTSNGISDGGVGALGCSLMDVK